MVSPCFGVQIYSSALAYILTDRRTKYTDKICKEDRSSYKNTMLSTVIRVHVPNSISVHHWRHYDLGITKCALGGLGHSNEFSLKKVC